MIGSKKLRAIRDKLRAATAAVEQDPIRSLENRVSAGNSRMVDSSVEGEVIQSLRRFLENPKKTARHGKLIRKKVTKELAK